MNTPNKNLKTQICEAFDILKSVDSEKKKTWEQVMYLLEEEGISFLDSVRMYQTIVERQFPKGQFPKAEGMFPKGWCPAGDELSDEFLAALEKRAKDIIDTMEETWE